MAVSEESIARTGFFAHANGENLALRQSKHGFSPIREGRWPKGNSCPSQTKKRALVNRKNALAGRNRRLAQRTHPRKRARLPPASDRLTQASFWLRQSDCSCRHFTGESSPSRL